MTAPLKPNAKWLSYKNENTLYRTVTRSRLFIASEQWMRKNFLEIIIHSAPLLT